MSAIKAEFVNYKLITGRKSIQIILEAPIEQANEITGVLGWPNAHESTWVGIARLQEPKEQGEENGNP